MVAQFSSPLQSHHEYALAVDQLVDLVGLIECPAMGEEPVDVDAALDRKARALGLDEIRERPGCHQRQLPAQVLRADVPAAVSAFADKALRAPSPGRADRVQPRRRIA